jgi:hypothetical protein
VIVLDHDLEFGASMLSYFETAVAVLSQDPSLFAASAWVLSLRLLPLGCRVTRVVTITPLGFRVDISNDALRASLPLRLTLYSKCCRV